MYASLSGGVEMLFVPAFMIGRHSAAALIHFAFAIALALAMFAYGRRIGKPWVGAAGAFLTFASPVVGIDASSAYNDVALAAVVFAAFYWLQIWDDLRQDLLLIPWAAVRLRLCRQVHRLRNGALRMVFVAYRSRRWKALLLVIACSIPMIAPWMIKNWIYVDNPVAPLANRIFRNPNVHVLTEEDWSRSMRRNKVQNKWTLPIELTLRGETTAGLIGPVFLLAPLAFLALRERAGRRLLAVGGVFLAVYFANIGTRFLIPCLPFFSLAMALPLANFPPLLAAMMIFHAVASWPPVLRLYSPSAWRLDRILYREALRIIPQDAYLRQSSNPYSVARLVEANVPKGERVLAMSAVSDAYTSREIMVSYQAAFNQSLTDSLYAGMARVFSRESCKRSRFPKKPSAGSACCKPALGIPWNNGASTNCVSSIMARKSRAGLNGGCGRGPIPGTCSSPSTIPLSRAGEPGNPRAPGCIWTSTSVAPNRWIR